MTKHMYRLDPHERATIEALLVPGTHVGYIDDPDGNRAWSVVHREPGKLVIEHWNRAMIEIDVKGDAVDGHRVYEGDEAKALRARLGKD